MLKVGVNNNVLEVSDSRGSHKYYLDLDTGMEKVGVNNMETEGTFSGATKLKLVLSLYTPYLSFQDRVFVQDRVNSLLKDI